MITHTYDRDHSTTGPSSQIDWTNPDFMEGLRTMFDCAYNEEITSIQVTKQGIRANFKIIPDAAHSNKARR